MNAAILHFHLRRGGVTSVMLQQAAGLAASGVRVILIAGTPPETAPPVPVYTVPGLDYDVFTGGGTGPEAEAALASAVGKVLDEAFPDGCDLLHAHNPLLLKNARLAGALRLLQRRGLRLLVQEHDFAEDFRPHVYDPAPYPENCLWAVVNPRDRAHLIAAGLAEDQVQYLPNPVAPAVLDTGPSGDGVPRNLALYPVRAIRRKNLGEAILLSRFLPEGNQLAVTLPPTSPADRPAYDAWKKFASRTGDRICFEAGLGAPLEDLYRRAFCAVTTSVKEGFGYSYLDPLVRGLPVAGRAVPAARAIFDDAGLEFDGLYSAIRIPRAELGTRLQAAVDERLGALRNAFAAVAQEWDLVETRLRARFSGRYVDFGALDETLQTEVLDSLNDQGFVREVIELNPFLETLFQPRPATDEHGLRDAVLARFAPEDYGRRLADIYDKACLSWQGAVDKGRLARAFLDPEAFFLTAS